MYHNILVDNAANIYVKNGQLHVYTNDDHSFPIEDLNTLVVGNRDIKISTYTLDALANNGSTVIVCGANHHPTGVLLPFGAYSRRLPMLKLQVKQSKPKIKRLWQQIVCQKIRNQGTCLRITKHVESIALLQRKISKNP